LNLLAWTTAADLEETVDDRVQVDLVLVGHVDNLRPARWWPADSEVYFRVDAIRLEGLKSAASLLGGCVR
jgi:hypothetical protein